MASGAQPARRVFLNVPFDTAYEDCFLALIAGLTGLGLEPHCVLEVRPGLDRLRRLYELLRSCRYSLHDLSRVESAGGYPRFNMPLYTASEVVASGPGVRGAGAPRSIAAPEFTSGAAYRNRPGHGPGLRPAPA